jgi:hypothetical protein
MRMSPSPLTPTPALQTLLHSDSPAVQQAARLALRGGRLRLGEAKSDGAQVGGRCVMTPYARDPQGQP